MRTIDYDSKYTDQIIDLWNLTLSVDQINKQRFINAILLDDNFSPNVCRIALDGEKVVGFIWSVFRKVPYGDRGTEPDRGWIVLLFVHPEYRRSGIGSQLVRETESIFDSRGIKTITVAAYSPNYLFPGVDKDNYPTGIKFFESIGYESGGSAVSMHRDLFTFKYPDDYLEYKKQLKDEGFSLVPYQLDDSEALVNFLKKNFPGGWGRNIRNAIINGVAEDTVLIMRNAENDIVGYCQRAIDGNPGRFGPFGVREDLRGKRLGMLLFNEMMSEMLKRQIYEVYFLWTGGHAQKFYERNGMKVYREFLLMRKVNE